MEDVIENKIPQRIKPRKTYPVGKDAREDLRDYLYDMNNMDAWRLLGSAEYRDYDWTEFMDSYAEYLEEQRDRQWREYWLEQERRNPSVDPTIEAVEYWTTTHFSGGYDVFINQATNFDNVFCCTIKDNKLVGYFFDEDASKAFDKAYACAKEHLRKNWRGETVGYLIEYSDDY